MIDATPFLGLGLLLVRPGALILASPAFGGAYAPPPVKIGLTVLLALMMAPVVPTPDGLASVGVTWVIAREFAIGVSLALAIRVLVAAAELGGHLIGFQIGLSYSAIVDPQSGVRNNVLAALYANIATIAFFLTNSHHAFLRALRETYMSMPMGSGGIAANTPDAIAGLLGYVFTFGLRLAAPILVVLFVTELALALVSRAAPSFNLSAVGAPVRLIIGLLVLIAVVPASVSLLSALSRDAVQLGVRTASLFR